ncbi:MAG: hypothetical protein K2X01_10235 [Cyanobacteria bacterium]|nr:hypothetical protein [Cyanobacteriota bacterium]
MNAPVNMLTPGFKPKTRMHSQMHFGQAASLAAIAFLLILAVVITSISMSRLLFSNAIRNIETRNLDASYNYAMAGIQEAIATRAQPRSNVVALESRFFSPYCSTGVPPISSSLHGWCVGRYRPVNPRSGTIYRKPLGSTGSGTGTAQELTGMYRYMIFGGHTARLAKTGRWAINDYLPPETSPPYSPPPGSGSERDNDPARLLDLNPRQPFFIVSRGAVCIDPRTRQVGVNKITYDSYLYGGKKRPVCVNSGSSNFQLKETTVLAVLDMSRTTYPNNDKIIDLRVFPNTAPNSFRNLFGTAPDVYLPNELSTGSPYRVRTTYKTYNAANSVVSSFNFNREWIYGSISAADGWAAFITSLYMNWYPAKVALYNLSDSAPYTQRTLNYQNGDDPEYGSYQNTAYLPQFFTRHGTVRNPAREVDPQSAIKVFFSDGVDFMSMFADQKIKDYVVGYYPTVKTCTTLDSSKCNIYFCRLTDHARVAGNVSFSNNPSNTAFITLPPPPGGAGGFGGALPTDYELVMRWINTSWGSSMGFTGIHRTQYNDARDPCDPNNPSYQNAYKIRFTVAGSP